MILSMEELKVYLETVLSFCSMMSNPELGPALVCDAARSHTFSRSLTSAYHTGLLDNRGIPEETGRPVGVGRDHSYVSQVYKVRIRFG